MVSTYFLYITTSPHCISNLSFGLVSDSQLYAAIIVCMIVTQGAGMLFTLCTQVFVVHYLFILFNYYYFDHGKMFFNCIYFQ